jgi:TBC1 domain family member 2
MNPLIPIFQKSIVQDIFQRVLYVWSVRHPGSGYVQGINDLLTPFFIVFLTEYCDIDTEIKTMNIESLSKSVLRQLEADSYWCMTKLLERIQENYIFSQPGIQNNVQSLENLISRMDSKLLHI